jgi:hypothetical protein
MHLGPTTFGQMAHLARRKEIYEAIHPETRHGGSPGMPGSGKRGKGIKDANSASLIPFAWDAAVKTGMAARHASSGIVSGVVGLVGGEVLDGPPLAGLNIQGLDGKRGGFSGVDSQGRYIARRYFLFHLTW